MNEGYLLLVAFSCFTVGVLCHSFVAQPRCYTNTTAERVEAIDKCLEEGVLDRERERERDARTGPREFTAESGREKMTDETIL